MMVLPIILIVIFSAIWLFDRSRGGYKVVKLAPEQMPEGGMSEAYAGDGTRAPKA